MVCTSIGLTLKGVPVIGVIYNPFMDQLVSLLFYLSSDMAPSPHWGFTALVSHQVLIKQYSAAKGRGAWLNEHVHLPVTGKSKPLTDLGQALYVTLLPHFPSTSSSFLPRPPLLPLTIPHRVIPSRGARGLIPGSLWNTVRPDHLPLSHQNARPSKL